MPTRKRLLLLCAVLTLGLVVSPAGSPQALPTKVKPRPPMLSLMRDTFFGASSYQAGIAMITKKLAGKRLQVSFQKRKNNCNWVPIAKSNIKIRRDGRVYLAFRKVPGKRCRFVAVWKGNKNHGPTRQYRSFPC